MNLADTAFLRNTRTTGRTGARGLALLAMICIAALAMLPRTAAAQAASCWVSSSPFIAFGTVTPNGASATGNLGYQCANGTPDTIRMRLCLYMNPNDPPGVAPRQMYVAWPTSYLDYDLYADPAHTQILGSETSGHPVYGIAIDIGPNGQTGGNLPLYARVPPGQTVAAGSYVSRNTVILRSTFASDGTTPDDEECAAGALQTQYAEVTADFANTCYLSTATDLDFGTVSNLDAARTQTSTISLNCPQGITWRVALDYGQNPAGGERQLAGPGGNLLPYQLYRDPGHTQVWGNTPQDDVPGTGDNLMQTLTVYGRIPERQGTAPGTYSDTITVTLTY